MDDGEQGVEVGLGLVGDLGEADQDVAPTPAVSPLPLDQVEPAPEEAQPPPTPPVAPASVATALLQRPAPPQAAASATALGRKTPSTPPRQKRGTGRASVDTTGASPGAALSYAVRLAAHLNRHKRYPLTARRRREEGVVELQLLIHRDGTLLNGHVSRPGSKALSEAALRMLEEAKPLPPFPDGMPQSRIDVVVPVSFKLRDV